MKYENNVELCEIAYCVWLNKIGCFDDMQEAFDFYKFIENEFIRDDLFSSLYDFLQEENLKKLHKCFITGAIYE